MNVTFYTYFSKRKNSTLQPTNTGTIYDCKFKDGCDILNPVFVLDLATAPFNLTYVYAFSRYYFIDKWVNVNNRIWEAHCSIDVLATYKSDIGSYTAFVERSASSYDVNVFDKLLSNTENITSNDYAETSVFTGGGSAYFVPVFGMGGCLLYMFNDLADAGLFYNGRVYRNFNTGNTYTDSEWEKMVHEYGSAGLVNVGDYMGQPFWLPFAPTSYITTSTVYFGFSQIDASPSVAVVNPNNTQFTSTVSLNMPTNAYSDFRKYNNEFSVYNMFLPGVGVVGLSATEVADDISVHTYFDFLTQSVTYKFYHSTNGDDIATFSGILGCKVPISQSMPDTFKGLQGGIGAISGLASVAQGNYVGGASSFASGMVDVAKSVYGVQPTINVGAGNRPYTSASTKIGVSVKNFGSKDFATTVAGRPTYANIRISTLSGFIKCGNASVSIYGYSSERDMVNNYLNSGFYYE